MIQDALARMVDEGVRPAIRGLGDYKMVGGADVPVRDFSVSREETNTIGIP